MRHWLRWVLGASIGLSAWVLLNPQYGDYSPNFSNGNKLAIGSTSVYASPNSRASVIPSATIVVLPDKLPQPNLEEAFADPFVGVPPPIAALTREPMAAPMQPTPTQVPPKLTYRYLGRILDLEGKLQVYMTNGTKDVLVSAATELDDGYRVQGLSATSIDLYYARLDYHVQLPLPPADSSP